VLALGGGERDGLEREREEMMKMEMKQQWKHEFSGFSGIRKEEIGKEISEKGGLGGPMPST